ncbi:MAG: helix-turn-helix domain-containing protein [Oscillospiraceae bacterium]|nr:helix-turn-helix domain-containing protein [Oscillospiraceae bacterium]
MDHAIHPVLDTDLKTYEIAEQVGYSNVRRFVDAFRDAYEFSPMDYRKLHGGR